MNANDDARGSLPPDFEEQARRRYDALAIKEVSFEQYLEYEKAAFQIQFVPRYKPSPGTMTPCGNGDLDQQIDPAQCQGGYGFRPGCSPVNFTNLTAGIVGGAIGLAASHQ